LESLLILAATTASSPLMETVNSVLGTAWTVLLVACGLGFVIFVHELGHFLVAKACGVKCEKFYIGFDFFDIPIPFTGWKIPRSLWKVQWGETEYGIGVLPLGGYVKMLGQDDDPRNAEAERARAHQAETAAEGLTPGHSVEPKPLELDPRSYPAKPVLARMAIISAGVIMNVISGVLMAAVAYWYGVPEAPARIGAMTAGDPAWTVGLQPGAQFLRFGPSGEDYEELRFDDLMRAAIFNGHDRELAFKVRNPDGSVAEYSVMPKVGLLRGIKRGTLGVSSAVSNELFVPGSQAEGQTTKPEDRLATGDRIIAVDGVSVADSEQKAVSGHALLAQLMLKPSTPVKLTVVRTLPTPKGEKPPEKPATKTLEITAPPRLRYTLGLVMRAGPIVAIRKGTPAEKAGFKIGDELQSIDGEPVGDPLTLEQRLLPKIGMPVRFEVSRGKETITLEATPQPPVNASFRAPTKNLALESIGIAYALDETVAAIVPGSTAEAAKLTPGGKIAKVKLLSDNKEIQEQINSELKNGIYTPDAETAPWTAFCSILNQLATLPEKHNLTCEVTYARTGKEEIVTLSPTPAADYYDEMRGLVLKSEVRTHRAEGMGEAFALGAREIKERILEVFTVIQRLVTGRLPLKMLGGPVGIMQAAGGSASAGIVPLIMFLVMLSANLAVLNSLPIPVLDGGHMVFLAAEGVRGKPVDENLQVRLTIVGAILLLSLVVFSTTNDLGRLIFSQ
jgi:regulator of sigma E protease